MHGVSSLTSPIASPLKPGPAKDLNHHGIHISNRPLQIGLRFQIDRDAPAVGRQFPAGSLQAKGKASAKARDPGVQPTLLNAAEDGMQKRESFVGGMSSGHGSRRVPRELQGKRQGHLRQEFHLPTRLQFPILPDIFVDVPERSYDLIQSVRVANGGSSLAADGDSFVAAGGASISLLLSTLRAIKMLSLIHI